MSLLPVDCFWWTMTAEDFDTTDADGFYWLRCRWWWARIIIIHQSNVIEYIYRYIYVYRLLSCFYHARTMYWCSLLVVAVYRHHSFLCVFLLLSTVLRHVVDSWLLSLVDIIAASLDRSSLKCARISCQSSNRVWCYDQQTAVCGYLTDFISYSCLFGLHSCVHSMDWWFIGVWFHIAILASFFSEVNSVSDFC